MGKKDLYLGRTIFSSKIAKGRMKDAQQERRIRKIFYYLYSFVTLMRPAAPGPSAI
jgi:hypothetical protein